ncbi:MAG: DUF3450 family protein [Planctomycetota bacterium]
MDHAIHQRRALRRIGAAATSLTLVAGFTYFGTGASSAAIDGDVDSTRATLEKWVETRQLISQEKRDWAEGRELMEARIELVKREIEGLRAKIADAEANVVAADGKRDELVKENESLQDATRSLAGLIGTLEAETLALLPRLPQPIRERVKLISQQLPEPGSETKLTLSERFLNVVYILNEADKFNREVSLEVEVRALADGTSVEVSTLYLGLGQAFYANAKGDVAGFGMSTADGWAWTAANDYAPVILEAIAIHGNTKPAAFVQLPLRVE